MLQGMDTGPAIEAPVPRMNVKGIESTRNMEAQPARESNPELEAAIYVATVKGAGAVTKLGALSSP